MIIFFISLVPGSLFLRPIKSGKVLRVFRTLRRCTQMLFNEENQFFYLKKRNNIVSYDRQYPNTVYATEKVVNTTSRDGKHKQNKNI